jgi:hypothetical protein
VQYHPGITNISQLLWTSQTPFLNTEKFFNGVLEHKLWLESGCWRAVQDEMVDLWSPQATCLDQNVTKVTETQVTAPTKIMEIFRYQTSACVIPY